MQGVSSLLPVGLYDLLPVKAAHERYVSGKLLEVFEQFGYAQVSPPLMEFESSLLNGRSGQALAAETFRVMDVHSQKMMAFRPDITLQVGRIAAVRMAKAPRPLRLCYNGSTLRMNGEGKEKQRQWRQAGLELIGVKDAKADAEVIAVAVQALVVLGVKGLVVDITFPGLVQQLLRDWNIPANEQEAIIHAVEMKDEGLVASLGLSGQAAILRALMDAAGDAEAGLARLSVQHLSAQAVEQVGYVKEVIRKLKEWNLPVILTLDPVENRGFEYHSLISFSIFSRDAQSELGRGGRYAISGGEKDEEATGLTLYVNALMDVVACEAEKPRILVANAERMDTCRSLHQQGYATVFAVDGTVDAAAAQAQGCGFYYANGAVRPVNL